MVFMVLQPFRVNGEEFEMKTMLEVKADDLLDYDVSYTWESEDHSVGGGNRVHIVAPLFQFLVENSFIVEEKLRDFYSEHS